jgi:hypothetical protein
LIEVKQEDVVGINEIRVDEIEKYTRIYQHNER